MRIAARRSTGKIYTDGISFPNSRLLSPALSYIDDPSQIVSKAIPKAIPETVPKAVSKANNIR